MQSKSLEILRRALGNEQLHYLPRLNIRGGLSFHLRVRSVDWQWLLYASLTDWCVLFSLHHTRAASCRLEDSGGAAVEPRSWPGKEEERPQVGQHTGLRGKGS